MTNQERWQYYESGQLQRSVAVQLLDWAGYWTTAGLDEITDPLQKEQTKLTIRMILTNLSYVIKIVTNLAISDDTIKEAEINSITESMIRTVIVSILASKLEWVTNISELPEE